MPVDLNQFPLLTAYLREQFGGAGSFNLEIHPNDEMFVPSPDIDQQTLDHSLVLYFHAGFAMLRVIEQIAQWRFGETAAVTMLDFASGFGRASRFFVQKFGAANVAVAEINKDAVDFQKREFGVDGYDSTTDPEEFQCPRKFDLVFAGSFFTHLPERTFRQWLAKLQSLVTPRGILVFSVHNENSFRLQSPRNLERNLAVGEDFIFDESQWSNYLSPAEYGNTLVSDRFLARALSELGEHAFIRIPYGLASFQDLCVAVPGAHVLFDSLCLDYGAEGNLDGARKEPDGKINLSGWAASRNPDVPVDKVRITVDGQEAGSVKPALRRGEVSTYLGTSAPDYGGWFLSTNLSDRDAPDRVLQARAVTTSGLDWLFYIGTLADALMRPVLWAPAVTTGNPMFGTATQNPGELARQVLELQRKDAALLKLVAHLESERATLREHIRAMEASRFWKLRKLWFRIKRYFHLSQET